jgi:hypothetical protein
MEQGHQLSRKLTTPEEPGGKLRNTSHVRRATTTACHHNMNMPRPASVGAPWRATTTVVGAAQHGDTRPQLSGRAIPTAHAHSAHTRGLAPAPCSCRALRWWQSSPRAMRRVSVRPMTLLTLVTLPPSATVTPRCPQRPAAIVRRVLTSRSDAPMSMIRFAATRSIIGRAPAPGPPRPGPRPRHGSPRPVRPSPCVRRQHVPAPHRRADSSRDVRVRGTQSGQQCIGRVHDCDLLIDQLPLAGAVQVDVRCDRRHRLESQRHRFRSSRYGSGGRADQGCGSSPAGRDVAQ